MNKNSQTDIQDLILEYNTSRIVFQEEEARIVVSLNDITDRKRGEKALRGSEEQYRTLVELSPDAIFIDCEGKLVLANRSAVVLFGAADTNELLGHNVLDLVHPDSRTLMEERMRKLQETNATLPIVENKLLRLDKSSFDAEGSATPFVFQGKRSALVIVRDITEKKALNEKLLRNQRLESIGTLAGGIAHDLNNVLAPILMSIEILRMKYPETKAERILETIETSALRGADMVRQVLAFARGVQGEHVTLQISHLIKEIVNILQQIFSKSIQFRTSIPQELWAMTGDATQLHQVLMNLCVNARDAMPGGGTLTVGAQNFLIDENFAGMNPEAKAGPYLIVTVTDTGTGIAPEVQDRMFEPFFTTKPLEKGTGLGLATVRGIVKSHGGFITVYSEVGNGTEFMVYLPAQKSDATKRVEARRQALPMGKGELILVVDDEATILNMAKQTLEMFGYQVLTAGDGAEATAVCAQNQGKIKLMLTDMMMPIMDGAATVHAVRRIDPKIKIIGNSGLGSDPKVTDREKLQVDAFFRKPYTAEKLLKTVHRVLSGEEAPGSP